METGEDEDFAAGDFRIGISPVTHTVTVRGPKEGYFVQYYSDNGLDAHRKINIHNDLIREATRLLHAPVSPGLRVNRALARVAEELANPAFSDLLDQGVVVDATGKPVDPALFDDSDG